MGAGTLRGLQAKRSLVDPVGTWTRVSYALISRSGFTHELRRLASSERVLIVTPAEMVA